MRPKRQLEMIFDDISLQEQPYELCETHSEPLKLFSGSLNKKLCDVCVKVHTKGDLEVFTLKQYTDLYREFFARSRDRMTLLLTRLEKL